LDQESPAATAQLVPSVEVMIMVHVPVPDDSTSITCPLDVSP
jgi:hypothetical protein